MGSFDKKDAKHKHFKISCTQCQANQNYQSLQELQECLSYNYDVLILVYKHRAQIAEKAPQFYSPPLQDPQSIDVLQVNKMPVTAQQLQKIEEERKILNQINFVFLQQQNQQKFLAQIREEVVCLKCYQAFDEGDKIPIVLTGCAHKICKGCHLKYYKSTDEEVFCVFCCQERPIKQLNERMQKWVIMQGKKRKILLKQEIEEIKRNESDVLMTLNKVSSSKKEEEKKIGQLRQSSGVIMQKQDGDGNYDNSFVMLKAMNDYSKSRISKRINTVKRLAESIGDRQMTCDLCSQPYSKVNRPIIMQVCPCQQSHQYCEECIKNNVVQMRAINHEPRFSIICPNTRQVQSIESNGAKNKQQLFQKYLILCGENQFIKVNEKLLEQLYSEQLAESTFRAEQLFAQQHGIQLVLEKVDEEQHDDQEPAITNPFYLPSIHGHQMMMVSARLNKVPSNIDDFNTQARCIQCKYDFSTGVRAPALLNCGHNLCIDCMRNNYYDESAFEEESKELEIKCPHDQVSTVYVRLEAFYDEEEIKQMDNDFSEFWRLNVTVNVALIQALARNGSDIQNAKIEFAKEFQVKQKWDIEEDAIEVHEIRQTPKMKSKAPETVKEDFFYDIECPICLLCYTHDNPPIKLVCSEHPNHPFVMCKNEMMYYAMKAGKDKDMEISCPVCHNNIKFATKGKKESEIQKMWDVNSELLDRIYREQNLRICNE